VTEIPEAPAGLKQAGRDFWNKAHSEFILTAAHDLERLQQACECLDVIREAKEKVEADGNFIRDRFMQIREHPGLKTIRDFRILFCRIIRELGLDSENPQESRPPRIY